MNLRELKLAIVTGNETEEIKSLNRFFDDLLNSLTIYTDDKKPDLVFMTGDRCIMILKNVWLYCRYIDFWEVLAEKYHCNDDEIIKIIQYKVEEYFKIGTVTIKKLFSNDSYWVEEYFKMGLLTQCI